MAFLRPNKWTESELRLAAARACSDFAQTRKTEGLDYYLGAYESAIVSVNELFRDTGDLLSLEDMAQELFTQGKLREVRYLASPPVSEDDLKSLAELDSIAKSYLSKSENARRAIAIILMNLDPSRFPWVHMGRRPTSEERAIAAISTASLMAVQQTQTNRRILAKENQENLVAYYLNSLGYSEVPRKPIRLAADAPGAGLYCRETKVGDKKADFAVGLADGRFMTIECKVSNSEVNSFKRLNHETVEKTQYWSSLFGSNGVVGAAVLAGVFKVSNLVAAQEEGVSLFWSFDLESLGKFIGSVE